MENTGTTTDKTAEAPKTGTPAKVIANPATTTKAGETAKDTTPKMSFPRSFPHKVFVRRKKNTPNLPIEGDYTDESIMKIGASYREKAVLRGLEPLEEERWLPKIMGVQKESHDWEKATKEYWNSISRPVPLTNKDGSGGLELEVGLYYRNVEDYEADQKGERDANGRVINPKGEPINLADYILWAYCLRYSKVANTPEDINKSPKIEFYLFSKEKEVKDKKLMLQLRQRATQIFYKRLVEKDWVDHMLRLLIAGDPFPSLNIKELSTIDPDEKEVMLEEYVTKSPVRFTEFAEDRHLEMKSFIEICVAMGILNRIPNTNSISYEGNTLGNTLDEVVTFLNNPGNSSTMSALRAQSLTRP